MLAGWLYNLDAVLNLLPGQVTLPIHHNFFCLPQVQFSFIIYGFLKLIILFTYIPNVVPSSNSLLLVFFTPSLHAFDSEGVLPPSLGHAPFLWSMSPLPLMPHKGYICARLLGQTPLCSLVGGIVSGNSQGFGLVDPVVLPKKFISALQLLLLTLQ